MKKKKWILAPENPGAASLLARELHLGALASRVLAARGFAAPSDAQEFLDAGNGRLSDPFLLRDMDKAVRILKQAIADGVRIAVYGDYDVDGVTATCILIRYLRSKGVDCTYYIPDRINEGYGLNTAAIQSLYDEGYRLLITVDSGITADEEALYAQKIGLPVIITDHHECKDILPDCVAVVDPHRKDHTYPHQELSGVGVAFKLAAAIYGDQYAILERYADLLCLGTIADVMPVLGENRTVTVKNGKFSDTFTNYATHIYTNDANYSNGVDIAALEAEIKKADKAALEEIKGMSWEELNNTAGKPAKKSKKSKKSKKK